MSKRCQVTGKRPGKGNKCVTRGIAKKKKGIGLNITGKTPRRFNLNLIQKRFFYSEENRFVKLKVSTQALRIIDKLGLHKVILKMRAEGKKV